MCVCVCVLHGDVFKNRFFFLNEFLPDEPEIVLIFKYVTKTGYYLFKNNIFGGFKIYTHNMFF